jgi:two-component system chemotaxis response regulator CheY
MNSNITILVIDDMQTMRKIIVNKLTALGFKNILEASDGMKAWEVLTQTKTPIDLIISDLNMPQLSGIELLKKVRQDKVYNQVPFIILTAEGELSQMTEAVKAGVTTYLLKPFTAESFKEKIQSVVK